MQRIQIRILYLTLVIFFLINNIPGRVGFVYIIQQRTAPFFTFVHTFFSISLRIYKWLYLIFQKLLFPFKINRSGGDGTVANAFAPQTEVLVFESQPRQTWDVKIGSDISTAKRSAICVCVTGLLWIGTSVYNGRLRGRDTLRNLQCSMALSSELRSKFAVLHR